MERATGGNVLDVRFNRIVLQSGNGPGGLPEIRNGGSACAPVSSEDVRGSGSSRASLPAAAGVRRAHPDAGQGPGPGFRAALAIASLLLAATVSPGHARAEDPPKPAGGPPTPAAGAAPTPAETALTAAAALMKARNWVGAEAAYRKALETWREDPAVLARLPRIEADLRRCAFQRTWKAPPVATLLPGGDAEFKGGIATLRGEHTSTLWSGSTGLLICTVPFDGDVSVSFDWTMVEKRVPHLRNPTGDVAVPAAFVLFCYDTEKQSGYSAGVELREFVGDSLWVRGFLREMTPGGPREFGKPESLELRTDRKSVSAVRAERKGTTISVFVNDKLIVRGNDGSGRKGGLGLLFPDSPPPRKLQVSGRVDAAYVRRLELGAEDAAFRAFSATWDRTTVLPEWVRAAEARQEARILLLPGMDDLASGEFATALRAYYLLSVDEAVPLLRALPAAGSDISGYVSALLDIALGEYESAEEKFDVLAGLFPDFAPAAYHLALCAFELDRENAGALAEAVCRNHPDFPPGWTLAAEIAQENGDYEKAMSILEDAIRRGIVTPETYDIRELLLRRDTGPDWARRFEATSTNYVVRTDHSQAVAADVLKLLDDARATFVQKFKLPPKAVPGSRKPVVYVFSNREGYDHYTGTFGAPPGATAGLYFPTMRQLCVWLHDDRAELVNTIRHEGFHQYLHGFVEHAPIWFNEGYAEYFGFSRRRNGVAQTGQADEVQRAMVGLLRPGFSPLADLLRMDQRKFMKKAEVHYVQAWSVIHFLRESKSPAAKGVLEACTQAIFAGKSATEVYAEVFQPKIDALDEAWRHHTRDLAR